MGRRTARLPAPGVWALRWQVARQRLRIWRAHHLEGEDYLAPFVLADGHGRLAKLYGSLARHARLTAGDAPREARLVEKARFHAGEARRYAALGPRRPGRGRPDTGGPSGSPGVPQPRGPRLPSLSGGAEAPFEEYRRVRAVAGATDASTEDDEDLGRSFSGDTDRVRWPSPRPGRRNDSVRTELR